MAYERRYKVGKFGGSKVYMSAKEIYDKVLEDSADNQLIADEAEELVRVCEESDFPKCYANKIRIFVLDSFTNLSQNAEISLSDKLEITCKCYNSLSPSKKEEAKTRQRFLLAFIKTIPSGKRSSYPEKLYNKLCKKWIKEKYGCYKSFKKINFERVQKSLVFDFEVTLMQAEKRGFFSNSSCNAEGEG